MIYELRSYTAMPGRLGDLTNRFATITLGLWEKHGIRPVGFWTALIGPTNQRLYYMLAWESLAERERIWNGFMGDKEWLTKRAETERNGPLIASLANEILEPTAFSPMK